MSTTQKVLKQFKDEVIKVDLAQEKEVGFIGMIEDLKHDPIVIPFPLPDNSVTLLSAANVISRINPLDHGFIKWMDEAWRVLKYGGQMRISTPYGTNTSYLSDPAATNPCTPQTFYYFDPLQQAGLYKKYKPKPWEISAGNLFFQTDGMMEILLIKRREDPSYKK